MATIRHYRIPFLDDVPSTSGNGPTLNICPKSQGSSGPGRLETLHVLEPVEVPVERGDCETLVGRDRRHPGVGKVDRVGLEPLQRVQHDRFRRHLETTTSDQVTKGVGHLGPVLLVKAGEDERGLGDDCGVEVQLDLSRGAQEDRGDGGVFPSGFSNSFGIPGLGSVGLDLRSLGSSDKGMLSRCTRGNHRLPIERKAEA